MDRRPIPLPAISAVLALLLALVLTPMTAHADEIIATGTWGTCTWSIDDNGLLLIEPTDGVSGQLADSGSGAYYAFPWSSKANFSQVRIGSGVVLPSDCSYMFLNCTELVDVQADAWDTSQVTTMKGMFKGCGSLYSVDVSQWDTSHVTDMSSLFWDCRSLGALALSDWDTSNVRFMDEMFLGCYGLERLDLSRWDTSSVMSMGKMFQGCSWLQVLDVSGWDTSQVTNMSSMFRGLTNITSLDVSGFDTYRVTDMSFMFTYCIGLEALDVSSWDTSQVTDMQEVFSDCLSLVALDVSGWNVSQATTISGMFRGCSGLSTLDVSGWDTSQVTLMGAVFNGCTGLTTLDVSGWNTARVTNAGDLFKDCSGLEAIDVSHWNTSRMREISSMFEGCSSLVSLDLADWNTSRVDMVAGCYSVFEGCSSLERWRVGKTYKIARNGGMVPDPTSDNEQWWSYADQRWYTRTEIQEGRSGIADVYTSYAVVTLPGIDVSSGEAYTLPDQMYTGEPIVPQFDVNYEGTSLGVGTDYELAFANNLNVGTATVTITACGAYSWAPRVVSFNILPKDISGVYVDYITWHHYSGGSVLPVINWVNDGYEVDGSTVHLGVILEEGKDYELSYTDTVNAGWQTAIIEGKGNYTGTKTVPFEIKQARIEESTYELAAEGSADPLRIIWHDRELVMGRDYELELPGHNVYPDAVFIVGKGNFTGQIQITEKDMIDEIAYRIDPLLFDLSNAFVMVQGGPFSFTGDPWTPALDVSLYGIGLKEGTDYEVVSWENNVMPGDATVNLCGIGRYTGSTTVSFLVEEPFVDVFAPNPPASNGTSHYENILWLFSTGISAGWRMPDGTREFRPYTSVARADMAEFLYRMAGSPAFTPTAAQRAYFSDVNDATAHHDAIWWLAAKGISQGWTVGTRHEFRPYAYVARADMAAFLMRMSMDDPNAEQHFTPDPVWGSYFSDINVRSPHRTAVLWLAQTGISQGWTVGSRHEFRPYSNVARADMAAFLHRMYNNGMVPEYK